MTKSENLLYKSKLSIESITTLYYCIVLIMIFPLISIIILDLTFGIFTLFLFIIPLLFNVYLLHQNQVKLFSDRIYYKNFDYQNPENKITDIYYKDIKSAKFVKTLIKEEIEIKSVDGKYTIMSIDFKDFIPELKKQLRRKWKE